MLARLVNDGIVGYEAYLQLVNDLYALCYNRGRRCELIAKEGLLVGPSGASRLLLLVPRGCKSAELRYTEGGRLVLYCEQREIYQC
jgi:hypothetical protein